MLITDPPVSVIVATLVLAGCVASAWLSPVLSHRFVSLASMLYIRFLLFNHISSTTFKLLPPQPAPAVLSSQKVKKKKKQTDDVPTEKS
jgi:hypothetical protein